MNNPLLSIIIPVHNRQKSLTKLLDTLEKEVVSVRNGKDLIEVIIIDDASTVPIMLPSFSSKIRLSRNKKNIGAPLSREKGLGLSRAKFIHFHDSDDSLKPHWLTEIINELLNDHSIDLLLTSRVDYEEGKRTVKAKNFFHSHINNPEKILSRLIFWNVIGPIGGVTFSRRALENIKFKNYASCQDWQMYIDILKNKAVLASRQDILFIFNKTGKDRISNSPRKKILGFLQLARGTTQNTIFKRNIRLFYLFQCRKYVSNYGGRIQGLYKQKRLSVYVNFIVISLYSFFAIVKLQK